MVRQEMEKHGLAVMEAGDEGESWARPNVIGTLPGGEGGPVLLLDAHTDVVPVYDPWTGSCTAAGRPTPRGVWQR